MSDDKVIAREPVVDNKVGLYPTDRVIHTPFLLVRRVCWVCAGSGRTRILKRRCVWCDGYGYNHHVMPEFRFPEEPRKA